MRGFNRFYTNRIGVLREGLLHTPYSLTEARVIFELGQDEQLEVAQLRRSLDVDAGYLSRILSRFEAAGLVARRRSSSDARRQVVSLTAAGRAEFSVLDERSASETREVLTGLREDEQRRLIASMDAIRGILEPSEARGVTLREPRAGEFERHGALYADVYGWDESFEALVARIVADYLDGHDPDREAAWIAEVEGERVGCVLCVREDDAVARLRLLLVEPSARGMGIGGRLVDECIAFAREAGYERLTLWTNDVLVEARRLYERAGFVLVEEETHHSFGHDLVGQNWTLEL